jgi:arylsulfatase A-like enzyme
MMNKIGFAFLIMAMIGYCSSAIAQETKRPQNILFIAVDDLRPELGAFGAQHMITPNIDKLAGQGFSFTNHFVHAPTCGASRFSLLTGRIATNLKHVSNEALRTEIGDSPNNDFITFPRYFRENGYTTVALGKIGHYPGGTVAPYTGINPNPRPEIPGAWDISKAPTAQWGTEQNGFFGYADGTNRNDLMKNTPPFEAGDVDDMGYPDGHTAAMAVDQIESLSGQDKPFLLAVGFYKPHLPFTAPKKYWDMYNRADIPLSPNPSVPKGVSEKNTLHNSGEFNQYKLGKETAAIGKPLSDDYARELRHAYVAAVSYIDAQIGKVLSALEKSGQADNTVVVLWGDHGWHLGDQTIWGKHSLYERALKSPLIIRLPQTEGGVIKNQIVETVDIYPTLIELTGLRGPGKLSGQSLTGAMENAEPSPRVARSFWQNSVTLRNDKYRIIVHGENFPDDVELYDHQKDVNETENVINQNLGEAMPLFKQALELMLEK